MNDHPFAAPPARAPAPQECYFYHSMEVPGHGVFPGQWDLRGDTGAYLGHVPLSGTRVLEIGPASGYLTFYMESAGAEVTACELGSFDQWDIVPYRDADLDTYVQDRLELGQYLQNGFWLAHHATGSSARLCLCPVYGIPENIGPFDSAVLGSVLRHVRDPFLALQTVTARTTARVVVTEAVPGRFLSDSAQRFVRPTSVNETDPETMRPGLAETVGPELENRAPGMDFMPRAARALPKDTWWQPTPSLIQEMLKILGFVEQRLTFHYQIFDPRYKWAGAEPEGEPVYVAHYTLVAERAG